MRVLVFGATGMVGQGVVRECLLDPAVKEVLAVGRNATAIEHGKLRDLVHADLFDLSPIEADLAGYDACFFCLGVSAAGMNEDAYRRITQDLTLAVATTLAKRNPGMVFVYVSGQGTDGTGHARAMWARVKGETENALLRMPFESYMFRPGFIQPMHGATSKTRLYAWFYRFSAPLFPVLRRVAPKSVTTSEAVGRAMLTVAKSGWPKRVLENPDINAAAAQ